MKKYELTGESVTLYGTTLYRIKALRSFGDVREGDLGGYIESENNLSQEGGCWVYKDAVVYERARVLNDAKVMGCAEVSEDSKICDWAEVSGHCGISGKTVIEDYAKVSGYSMIKDFCRVSDNAEIRGDVMIRGDIEISGNAIIKRIKDYIVFKNWWSSGRSFVWTRSNNMWRVGCFYGTGKELIKKAYEDDEKKGREYERIVRYVEEISKEEREMKERERR